MDLAPLALHELSAAFNRVLIGDGTGLSIANIGSFTFTSLPTPLLFTNVLHVLAMSKNLILVFALCVDNPINVLLFYSFSQVQDCHIGVTLVADNIETMSITGRSQSLFGLPPWLYLINSVLVFRYLHVA